MVFEYKTRTQFAWLIRANQWADSCLVPAETRARLEPEPPARVADALLPKYDESGESTVHSAKKVTLATLCLCGHSRGDHHLDPTLHWPAGNDASGWFYCLTEHCSAQVHNPATNALEPCTCLAFRIPDTETELPKLKRPRVEPWTACGRCGHRREHHCTKFTSKKDVPYKGFATENGMPFICSHYQAGVEYKCESGHCAIADERGTFCACEKFVNPFLAPRKKSATKATGVRRKRKSDVQAELLLQTEPASLGRDASG